MKSKVILKENENMEMTSGSPDDPGLKKRWGCVSALPGKVTGEVKEQAKVGKEPKKMPNIGSQAVSVMRLHV